MNIAIDFDGTIAAHEFPAIGDPVPGAFEWMKRFQQAGASLFLWTMRSDGQESGPVLSEAVEFCKKHGVEFVAANHNPSQASWTTSPKMYAHVYIDDAAFGCPLSRNPKTGGRPFVNWSLVGPAVMKLIDPTYKAPRNRKAKKPKRCPPSGCKVRGK